MESKENETNVSLEAGFDREWARATLDHCVDRLRHERARKDQLELFEALIPFLIGDGEESIKNVALQLGQEEGTIRVAVHRLRKRIRELLREEVGKTLQPDGDLASELRYLASILD